MSIYRVLSSHIHVKAMHVCACADCVSSNHLSSHCAGGEECQAVELRSVLAAAAMVHMWFGLCCDD